MDFVKKIKDMAQEVDQLSLDMGEINLVQSIPEDEFIEDQVTLDRLASIKDGVKPDYIKMLIRNSINNYYDIQQLRIKTGNRIFQMYLDLHPEYIKKDSLSDADREKAENSFMKVFYSEYKKVLNTIDKEFGNKGRRIEEKAINSLEDLMLIKSKDDFNLVHVFHTLKEEELRCSKIIADLVESHPMWDMFFKDAKGIGPVMAGVLLGYLDVHKARHVSSFWSFAGVGTVVNDEGERVCQSRATTVEVTRENKYTGKMETVRSINYNARLHNIILGVMIPSVIKTGKGGKYNEVYYDYKNRFANRADLVDASAQKIHRMAVRAAAKELLRDLWVVWRSYEGYEISKPYEVEYLNRAPHEFNEFHYRRSTV